MPAPTEDQIKLCRDAMLESYLRRNPAAQPEPGTSLWAVLEGASGPLAAIMAAVGSEAEAAIHDFLDADRQEIIQPEPDERAFVRIEEPTEFDDAGEIKKTKKNPEREKFKKGDEWPCQRNAEGSF